MHYTLLYERNLELNVSANQTLGNPAKVDLSEAEVEPFTVALVAALVDG